MDSTDTQIIRDVLLQFCNDCYMDEDTGEFGDCVCGGEVLFALAALDRLRKAE